MRAVLGLVLLLGLAGPSWATGFEDGLLAYHRGDHEAALEIWEPLARQGDPSAQYSLGLMHYRGEGVAPDPHEAAHWYRKAAEQGDPDAQLNLGLLYAMGEGVQRNYLTAYKWFSLAYWGYPPGEYRDMAARNRENAAAAMTPEQVAEGNRLVRNWKPERR